MIHFLFGPALGSSGVLFHLWAPMCDEVYLIIEGGAEYAMHPAGDGWHHCEVPDIGAGTLYAFRLPDGLKIPDPASRFQPQDVHGSSEVIDLAAYAWRVVDWRGRPWEEMVLYEMHIGTFTPGLRLSLRRRGLVQPEGFVVAAVNHDGGGLLVEAVEEALARHGKPEIFNTDRDRSSPPSTSRRC